MPLNSAAATAAANAVVSPTGSPTVLTAPGGGGAVTGTGKIT